MALRHLVVLIFAAAVIGSGCSPAEAPVPEPEDPGPLSVTRWTDRTELFAEYPALVAGETSRFAIHLTRLESFAAVTEGRVEVQLRTAAGAPEVFTADEPSRPGIFGVDVTPAAAGTRQLVIILRAPGLEDEHQAGEVQVHATADEAEVAAAAAAAEAFEGISFLKEQQWNLEFGTALVVEAALRESIRVPASVEARPSGVADVAAPIDGRLTLVADATPGASVVRGQELARLLPPPSAPAERPQLERGVAEAQSSLALAVRDRERAERLTAAGAVPERRADEARAAEEQARARLTAAEASLTHHDTARSGSADAEGVFIVRAPISGVVARRDARPGAAVAGGAVLFTIVDASQVQVVGQIPELDASVAASSAGAEVEVPRRPERVPAGRRVSVGRMLDPLTRTLPIIFALDNRQAGLPVGQPVFLHLFAESTSPGPVVPASALVDDAGRPIVFVQREGEAFERRPVTVGVRQGGLVQILAGVRAGDRVVTRGAFLIRLASLSTSVPAHGHVH